MLHSFPALTHVPLLAEDEPVLFLGEDFLPWMVLAFGAALVVGNVLALLRPPTKDGAGEGVDGRGATSSGRSERPPLGRTVVMIAVGLVAAGWGLASLLA